jgi:hypothetical protein
MLSIPRHRRLAGSLLCIFLLTSPSIAMAATGDNIGINAARRIAEAIESSVRTLDKMQERFHVDLLNVIVSLKEMEQDAFKRIDQITEDRVSQVERLVNTTMAAIKGLEEDAFAKINDLVVCTPQIMTNAIETSLSNLKIWGWTINYRSQTELNPAFQYYTARDEILKGLEGAKPETRVEGIMAAYDEIARLAELAQCHFKTKSTGVELVKQSKFYAELAAPWAAILRD